MRIEFDCSRYNPRQYGMPWGAVVKFEGWKMVCDFSVGTFLGNSAKGGKLYIKCQPGDTIAVGQECRDRGNYIHKSTLYTVEEDGNLKLAAEITVLEYGKGRQEPEPPLAKYSTEELITELHQRGVNINCV